LTLLRRSGRRRNRYRADAGLLLNLSRGIGNRPCTQAASA
jgi:hypothetical protein